MLLYLGTHASRRSAYTRPAINGIADPSNAATTTLAAALTARGTAITTFQSAAASYLTSIAKVQ